MIVSQHDYWIWVNHYLNKTVHYFASYIPVSEGEEKRRELRATAVKYHGNVKKIRDLGEDASSTTTPCYEKVRSLKTLNVLYSEPGGAGNVKHDSGIQFNKNRWSLIEYTHHKVIYFVPHL